MSDAVIIPEEDNNKVSMILDMSIRDITSNAVHIHRSHRLGWKAYKGAFSKQWNSEDILTINEDGSITSTTTN